MLASGLCGAGQGRVVTIGSASAAGLRYLRLATEIEEKSFFRGRRWGMAFGDGTAPDRYRP